jgi:hypothetical protein
VRHSQTYIGNKYDPNVSLGINLERICSDVQLSQYNPQPTHLCLVVRFGDMVQLKVHYVLLALGAAAANSDRHQVLTVSHRSTLDTSAETPEYLITTPAQVTTSSDAATVNVDVAFHRRVVFTNSISERANATASVSIGPTAGADAVRAGGGPPREWSSISDTVVMALLGLTSIVVAVVLGRKQLRAMRVQLHIMLDTAHRHPRANHVEMNDLESGQYLAWTLDGLIQSTTLLASFPNLNPMSPAMTNWHNP